MSNHHLYRHFDADDNLLYIGISKSAFRRLQEHESTAVWANDIKSMTIERFESRSQLVEAEKIAIFWEKPLHNYESKARKSRKYGPNHGATAILDRCKDQGVTPMDAKVAIHLCGGSKKLQELFGISKASVSNWKVIPDTRCVVIERTFGIPCSLLRPDIFPLDWKPITMTEYERSEFQKRVKHFEKIVQEKRDRAA